MKNNFTWFLLCLACMMTLSCSDKKNTADESEKGVSTVLPDTKNEVAVQILKKRDFHHELVSNGKISARGKADLRFETGEVIAHIYVKNGDRVQKGQKLADLDKFRLEQKLSQSEDALLKAELELKDVLIGQGYSPDDFSKVPAETMKIAKVKSGYEQSKSQYELAKREMEHATLIAPFDGVVANLFSKPYNPANTSEAFCTIIDSKGMEADFTVLENELAFIRMGDKVVITPYAGGDAFEGSVSEINPLASSSSGHLAKRSALSEIIATARFLICSFASSTRSSLTSSGALFMALTNAATPSSTLEFCNEDCHAAASPFNIQAL